MRALTLLLLLAVSASPSLAYLFHVDSDVVFGGFEFDGSTYTAWTITTDPGDGFVYTTESSMIADTNYFGLDTNVGANNLFLRSTSGPYRELWLTFPISLLDLDPGQTTTLSPGTPFSGGSYEGNASSPLTVFAGVSGTAGRDDPPDVPEPGAVWVTAVGLAWILAGRIRRRR